MLLRRPIIALLVGMTICGAVPASFASAEEPAGAESEVTAAPYAVSRDYGLTLRFNGRAIDAEHAAYRRSDGTLFVSARTAAEALGMKAAWNAKKRLAEVVTANGQLFAFPLAREYFWFNGQRYDLPDGTEIEAVGGGPGFRVMVPASAIGKLFGADVKWDAEAKRLDIAKADGSVPASRSASFAREWDVWSPEPGDELLLAQALFPRVKTASGQLTVTVPRSPASGGAYSFVYYQGSKETALQPGHTYAYPLGRTNAGVYANRTDASGAIREEYWLWLDPGSPNLAYSIYAHQGLQLLIQDMRGKPVSLERMRQVAADAGRLTDCGTARLGDDAGSANGVPLYCVAASYGASDPGTKPRIKPSSPLPKIAFDLPPELQGRLAAYWVNMDGSGGERGLLFLAPRGWEVETADVGADGSAGSAGIRLRNPRDPAESFSASTIPGCQGCAISAIGTYFPELRQWAEDQSFPGEDIGLTDQHPLGPNGIAYAKPSEAKGYAVRGVAYERHGQEGGAAFARGELALDGTRPELAATVLDFLAKQLPAWV